MKTYFVYITTSGTEEAERIGKSLVEEKLAACINVLFPMTSMYWWEGELCRDQECVLIAKTTVTRIERLTERVKELHSYDCPCVAAIPVEAGNEGYLKWITDSTM
ncbi:MAG: divalent-cation tolerance protein CutA [Balneolales bacterium]